MKQLKQLIRRLRYLLNRSRLDAELANEMEFHRQMTERGGHAHFGSTLRLREESRDAWGWTWVDRFFQDFRYAIRMLRKAPGFTLAALLTLAIGIGANVAAFGFFNLIVLKPLTVRDPGTLLRLKRQSPQSYASNLPYPEMAFLREHSKAFAAVIGVNETKLTLEGGTERVNANFVTTNFFSELGGQGQLGRMIDPALDGAKSAAPGAVLSFGF